VLLVPAFIARNLLILESSRTVRNAKNARFGDAVVTLKSIMNTDRHHRYGISADE